MATPAKINGRKTNTLAATGKDAASMAHTILVDLLADPPTEPIEYVKAIGAALKEIKMADEYFGEIVKICDLDAVRNK